MLLLIFFLISSKAHILTLLEITTDRFPSDLHYGWDMQKFCFTQRTVAGMVCVTM